MGELERREPDEDKKVEIVPVEQLIPEIKPPQTEGVKGVDYKTNKFGDPFILDFIEHEFKQHTNDPEIWPALKERLKNQVIVDLGAGSSVGYILSAILGAEGYIGVDKYHTDDLRRQLEATSDSSIDEAINRFKLFSRSAKLYEAGKKPEPGKDLIPASIAEDDMLSFLKRLPDNSVSVFTFGITHEIVAPSYSSEVAKEIERVLSPDGLYITDSSSIPTKNLTKLSDEIKDRVPSYSLVFLENEGFFVKK